ncbi:hypothetical protein AB0H37_19000 [Actinomadura sp. NPDC023710]|uniref:hypothetical protein n=1 Tax=Actinomadura sp. NPDC023710 TaxID=3158219 RepID=UPI00340BCA5F
MTNQTSAASPNHGSGTEYFAVITIAGLCPLPVVMVGSEQVTSTVWVHNTYTFKFTTSVETRSDLYERTMAELRELRRREVAADEVVVCYSVGANQLTETDYHVVISAERQLGSLLRKAFTEGMGTVEPGDTRERFFQSARQNLPEDLWNGSILEFVFEPDRITAA